MQERVQKILARNGIASRRQAEQMIAQGRVMVNGRVCRLGDTADEAADQILVDGIALAPRPRRVYIMMNKPRGYVTTRRDEKGRRTVMELVDCPERVYPVGRLDMDSEGLLLLTNDGDLTNRLLHPSGEVRKTYLVWVQGATAEGIAGMSQAMDIEGYRIRPAQVRVLNREGERAKLEVTIHEGRNRQIRNMAAQCGMRVTRLQRVSEGSLKLGRLPLGAWRYLTENEIRSLREL